MKITYFGHACFLIQTKGKSLMFDPFVTRNKLAKDIINLADYQIDYMLLSHGHFDHVADVEIIAKQSGAKVISNWEIQQWFSKKGIKGHPMNHGGKWEFEFGTVYYTAAVHSSNLPDGSYGGNPGGFIIHNEEGTLYYSGDTAVTMDMKLLPILCPKIDLAILPIGDNFTMDSKGAALAAEFIDCDRIIGCHFDTFEEIEIDTASAKADFTAKGKELTLLPIGGSLEV